MYLVTSQRSGEQHHGNAVVRLSHTEESLPAFPLLTFILLIYRRSALMQRRTAELHTERDVKEVVVGYFQAASLHLCGGLEKIQKSQVRKQRSAGRNSNTELPNT